MPIRIETPTVRGYSSNGIRGLIERWRKRSSGLLCVAAAMQRAR